MENSQVFQNDAIIKFEKSFKEKSFEFIQKFIKLAWFKEAKFSLDFVIFSFIY